MSNKIFIIITVLLNMSLYSSCGSRSSKIKITKSGDRIFIQGSIPSGVKEIEVHILSQRNHDISSYHDVSPINPGYKKQQRRHDSIARYWNIFYPVVDVELKEKMKGIVCFDTLTNLGYSINGMFHKKIFQLDDTMAVINPEYLIHWENAFYVQPGTKGINSFYLQDLVETVGKEIQLEYVLLSPDWGGRLELFGISGTDKTKIGSAQIANDVNNILEGSLDQMNNLWLSRNRLIESLKASIEFTLGCQDKSANSPTRNGLNLFYDLDARTYRRPTWIWGWGPSIRLLVKSSGIPEIEDHFGSRLLQVASEIGETSLKFQNRNQEHPAYGLITSRWNETGGTLYDNFGYEHLQNIGDAQFLVGNGWIPLFEVTGNDRYLDGAILLTRKTEELMQKFDVIPMDYKMRADEWKNYTLNEQAFGLEGIAELYRVTRNSACQEIGDDYLQMLLEVLGRVDGLWDFGYFFDTQESRPMKYRTRSQGWVMEGLLAAYSLTGKQEYLGMCKEMSVYLMENQSPDGHWNHPFTAGGDEAWISEKGTALWCWLFYRLYKEIDDRDYLHTARKALIWCLNNQYDGSDLNAYGGLVGEGAGSGVVYRQWFPMECVYTSGFFGLAVLEELALQGEYVSLL